MARGCGLLVSVATLGRHHLFSPAKAEEHVIHRGLYSTHPRALRPCAPCALSHGPSGLLPRADSPQVFDPPPNTSQALRGVAWASVSDLHCHAAEMQQPNILTLRSLLASALQAKLIASCEIVRPSIHNNRRSRPGLCPHATQCSDACPGLLGGLAGVSLRLSRDGSLPLIR